MNNSTKTSLLLIMHLRHSTFIVNPWESSSLRKHSNSLDLAEKIAEMATAGGGGVN